MKMTDTQTTQLICSPKGRAILDAALSLFLANGYGQTSMDAIAKKAGVAKQTVYSYFNSKEQLFTAIMCSHCSSAEMFDNPNIDALPEVALPILAEEILVMVSDADRLALHRIVMAESAKFPELGKAFYVNGPGDGIKILSDYFRRQTSAGRLSVPNPDLAAEYFLSMAYNFPHMESLLGISKPLNEAQRKARAKQISADFLRMFKK